MRITNKVLTGGYLSDLNRNLENMRRMQEQLSSGKEIRRPSDDPFRVARTMELLSDIAGNERYTKNIDEGIGWLNTVESAMGQMTDVLQTIREKTVAGGNGTYSIDERRALMDNMIQLKEHLKELGNTSFDGRYVFAGDKTTEPPFTIDKETGGIIYSGSQRGIIREFAQGVKMDIGLTGDNFLSVFGNAKITDQEISMGKSTTVKKTGTPIDDDKIYEVSIKDTDSQGEVKSLTIKIGDEKKDIDIPYTGTDPIIVGTNEIKINVNGDDTSVEINGITLTISKDIKNKKGDVYSFNSKSTINVLDKIINSLKNNENASEYLGEIDSKFSDVLMMRSQAGARWQRLNDMKAKSEEENFNMTELLSKTSDIDVAKKYMEYKVMESVYMASLQTGAKILQPSILDFLR